LVLTARTVWSASQAPVSVFQLASPVARASAPWVSPDSDDGWDVWNIPGTFKRRSEIFLPETLDGDVGIAGSSSATTNQAAASTLVYHRCMSARCEPQKARVFLSCGQDKASDEIRVAEAIGRKIIKLGFDCYVATQEQTLRGIRENIFEKLNNYEYFIFVDFKREQLVSKTEIYRGSLFSHQELAIASFLAMPVIVLQEVGVKERDGMLGCFQANAISFSDRSRLPTMVADRIRAEDWDCQWRNELHLQRDPAEFTDALIMNLNKTGRFFHINVANNHRSKIAINSSVYLTRIKNINQNKEIIPKTVELKWAGFMLPTAHILPRSARYFDAFFILSDDPLTVNFQAFTDAGDYIPSVRGEGEYEFSYVAIADNFPQVTGTFRLHLDRALLKTTFV
jgi:hypothetical protein